MQNQRQRKIRNDPYAKKEILFNIFIQFNTVQYIFKSSHNLFSLFFLRKQSKSLPKVRESIVIR